MTNQDLIECIKKVEEGKGHLVQQMYRNTPFKIWEDKDHIRWNTCEYEYRIKPEPKEVWIWEHPTYLSNYHFKAKEACIKFHEGARGEPRLFREVTE